MQLDRAQTGVALAHADQAPLPLPGQPGFPEVPRPATAIGQSPELVAGPPRSPLPAEAAVAGYSLDPEDLLQGYSRPRGLALLRSHFGFDFAEQSGPRFGFGGQIGIQNPGQVRTLPW